MPPFLIFRLLIILLFLASPLSNMASKTSSDEKACSARPNKVNVAPYGSWKSPLSSSVVTKSSISFQELRVDPTQPDVVFWSELHPEEEGSIIIFSFKTGDDNVKRWTPANFSSKNRVHEYGGGAFIVHGGIVYFSNDEDQRIYAQRAADDQPKPITPDGVGYRYADCEYQNKLKKIFCVREDHSKMGSGERKEPENTIVMIDIETQKQEVVVSGCDFYASPRLSHDGSALVWMQWNHPNMPWDDTEVWMANLTSDGSGLDNSTIKKVFGKPSVNTILPRWTPDGKILFINDETGWWNLYLNDDEGPRNLHPTQSDFGAPQWQFGHNLFSCHPSDSNKIAVTFDKVPALLDRKTGDLEKLPNGDYYFNDVLFSSDAKSLYAIAYGPTTPVAIVKVDLASKSISHIRVPAKLPCSAGHLSKPELIEFPTMNGSAKAYGYYYSPKNQDYVAPNSTLPPLLVKAHGGPTSAASLGLDLGKQYFTSRGFAILDVDYRGSTGYGRKYRTSLYTNWGVHDIEDCCSGAQYLVDQGKVDKNALTIDGGSAGGYTTLACLTFRDLFKAGASHYGISDLEILAKETHKFESRYLDQVIAPYPAEKQIYYDRSPINSLDKLKTPVAFFQGELDKVVPPNQAEMMYNQIKNQKLACAYVLFPDEYHGFVKAKNKRIALDGEFYFFSKVLGFEAADEGIEIPIDNL